jgi:hypothetical protein
LYGLDLPHDFHIGHNKLIKFYSVKLITFLITVSFPCHKQQKFATPTTQATTLFSRYALTLFRKINNSGCIWFTVFVSLPVVAMGEFFSDWAHICDLLADVGICIELQKYKPKDKKI